MRKLLLNRSLLFLGALALAAACSAATVEKPDTITFSHHVHAEQGLMDDCSYCHSEISEDAEREIYAFMKMDGCADCHDIESEEECGTCHTNVDDPGSYDRPGPTHLIFSHQLHEDRSSDCADCHGDASLAADISPENRMLPAHEQCNMCHQEDMDAGKCQLCHDRLDLYTRKPGAEIYSHADGFFERHGLKAASGEAEHCAICHDQSFCGDCHARTMTVRPSLRFPERVDRSFMHQGDWMTRHSIEARRGDTSCMKCHGTSYCSSCHEQNGVGGALGRKNPHPAGWLIAGTADSHSRAARRRIHECASCHDQGPATNCIRCHRTGGVNPHPPGWKSPVPKSEKTTHKMCRLCHTM